MSMSETHKEAFSQRVDNLSDESKLMLIHYLIDFSRQTDTNLVEAIDGAIACGESKDEDDVRYGYAR
jgi:hypothetical protein